MVDPDSPSSPLTPKLTSNLPFDFHKPASHSTSDSSSPSSHAAYQASHPHWSHLLFPSHWKHLPHLSAGAGPFTTKLVHQTPSGHRVHWESRKHRKRLRQHVEANPSAAPSGPQPHHAPQSSQQAPADLLPWYSRWFPLKLDSIAWWTAILFDIGSLCFVFSSICEFIPGVYNNTNRT